MQKNASAFRSSPARTKGAFQGVNRLWLRWFDQHNEWILTETEQVQQRADRLAEILKAQGIDPDSFF